LATPRKHWVKIASSLLREPWPDREKLTLVLLSCYLNDRWARDGLSPEQACEATLTRGDLAAITRANRIDIGRKRLESLRDFCSISLQPLGDLTKISWPKFAEFQQLGARSRGNKRAYADADADADAKGVRKKRSTGNTEASPEPQASAPKGAAPTNSEKKSPAPKRPASARKRKTPCPEDLSAEQWAQVHAWRDDKHPEFSDRELKAQWERHANWHISRENTAVHWTRSFYNWLLGTNYKPLTSSQVSRPLPPPVRREKPPPEATKADWDAYYAEKKDLRKGTRLRPH